MRYQDVSKLMGRRVVAPLMVWLAFVVGSGRARAENPKACAEYYEKAQEERRAGHITAAIESLTKCAARECPPFVSKDCIQWLSDAQKAQPSVVFTVRRDGVELTDVEIAVDGQVLTESIDGKAIFLDPGPHVFTFRALDGASSQDPFIIREGEQNRIIEIDLGRLPMGVRATQTDAPSLNGVVPADGVPVARPTRSWLPYGLLAGGALGFSGFAAFGLWGHSQENHLRESCAPYCRSSQVDQVRTKYIVADACLAVGLVSFAVATYLFFRDPGESAATSSVAFGPAVSHQGGAFDVAIRF